jgi:hypothetical protein
MKPYLWPSLLVALGLLIVWLGLSATSAIGEAYETACRAHPRCPSVNVRIFLLDLLVIACAFYLPWELNGLFASRDGGAPH